MEETFTNAKWSAYAKTYSSVFESLTARWAVDAVQIAHHEILHLLQQYEATSCTTPFHFVDVGCGPGNLSFEFARRYLTLPTDIRITASDISDGMLKQLMEKLMADPALNSFAPKFCTLQSDGMFLSEVADSSVDAIGSNFGLSIFPNRMQGYATAFRVLKEEGLLVMTTWSDKSSQIVWFDTITDAFNAAGPPEDKLQFPSTTAGSDRERVMNELHEAGFRDVRVYSTTHTIVFDDPKAMIQAMMTNPFAAKFLKRLSKDRIEQMLIELMESDAQKNFYQDERMARIDGADGFVDKKPCLIPFTGYVIAAKK
ncbi:hypothetical protein CCR75_000762 [Bremia lactucae]|uniref:Methyltransferase domain-containing protein n=1 Tax=Bremia lactucae TaxID=4779 RepID=A0A976NXU8_BRELC|nr:hypothetical protein CCR75_000762 [Bremia lactucae]